MLHRSWKYEDWLRNAGGVFISKWAYRLTVICRRLTAMISSWIWSRSTLHGSTSWSAWQFLYRCKYNAYSSRDTEAFAGHHRSPLVHACQRYHSTWCLWLLLSDNTLLVAQRCQQCWSFSRKICIGAPCDTLNCSLWYASHYLPLLYRQTCSNDAFLRRDWSHRLELIDGSFYLFLHVQRSRRWKHSWQGIKSPQSVEKDNTNTLTQSGIWLFFVTCTFISTEQHTHSSTSWCCGK